MAHEQILECTFLIPTHRDANLSDGQSHPSCAWNWLKEQLWHNFNGFTVADQHYHGMYRDPDTGEPVTDVSKQFVVALPRQSVSVLQQVLCEACLVFEQKCIYLSVGGEVEFIERPEI